MQTRTYISTLTFTFAKFFTFNYRRMLSFITTYWGIWLCTQHHPRNNTKAFFKTTCMVSLFMSVIDREVVIVLCVFAYVCVCDISAFVVCFILFLNMLYTSTSLVLTLLLTFLLYNYAKLSYYKIQDYCIDIEG